MLGWLGNAFIVFYLAVPVLSGRSVTSESLAGFCLVCGISVYSCPDGFWYLTATASHWNGQISAAGRCCLIGGLTLGN